MKIDEALIIFYNLKNNTVNKTESEIYKKFITILLDLQQRDFTSNQKKDLETKLLSLNLKNNLNATKKDLKKKLTSFEFFLTNEFSIISENHYVSTGMALWLFSSVILFYCFGQFSVIGALLATIIIGKSLDLKAKMQGRVIKIVDPKQESFLIEKPVVLNDFSEEEKFEEKRRKELQEYRRKKLQQFGQEHVQEQNIKKPQY